MKLLKEKWLGEGTEQNLLDYVSNFRFKLRRACEIARDNIVAAQARMKGWYDRRANSREFLPGDKVLVLLLLPGPSLQACYSGPYLVLDKVGDRNYLVATPDRRRRTRLCHVNMLKAYCDREDVQLGIESSSGAGGATLTSAALSGAEVTTPRACLVALSGADMGDGALSVALTQG